MNRKQIIVLCASVALALPAAALAQHSHDRGSMGSGDHSGQADGMKGHKMDGKMMGGKMMKSRMMGHERSQLHGGHSMMTKGHHFEVVYVPDGIRLYAYDKDQNPMSPGDMKGEVTLMYKEGEPKTVGLVVQKGSIVGKGKGAMQMNDYLFAPVDLSGAESGSFRARFALTGMSGEESETSFVDTYGGVSEAEYACPMHPDVWAETDDAECPLCGMKTSMARHMMMMKGEMMGKADHGGHDQR